MVFYFLRLESDTNKELSQPKDKRQKVLFDKRVCFLAACVAGDYEEINNLLSRGAADIDACQVQLGDILLVLIEFTSNTRPIFKLVFAQQKQSRL